MHVHACGGLSTSTASSEMTKLINTRLGLLATFCIEFLKAYIHDNLPSSTASMRDVLCILLLASTVCDSRTVLPRNYKSFSLTSRCDNVSDTAASAFDGAYRRGWSGGQKSTASFKAYVSQSVSYYYKNPTDRESASGMGSNLGPPTAGSLQILRHTIQNYDVHTMVDVPCGDVNWQFGEWAVDSLQAYVGLDILPKLIKLNQRRFAFHSNKDFAVWDISQCQVPHLEQSLESGEVVTRPPDLVHMRYVLQHMTLDRALQAVINVVESGAHYFLATTYPAHKRGNSTRGVNIMMVRETGFYLNDLSLPPFSMPPPVQCSDPGANSKESPGLMCLYNLRNWDNRGKQSWLQLAQRTRVVGHGTRHTTFTYA